MQIPRSPVRFRLRPESEKELSRLAQLVERKTLNLVVVGSSPTVGVPFCSFWYLAVRNQVRVLATGVDLAPVAQLAARRSHNPKVASSILAGSIQMSVWSSPVMTLA